MASIASTFFFLFLLSAALISSDNSDEEVIDLDNPTKQPKSRQKQERLALIAYDDQNLPLSIKQFVEGQLYYFKHVMHRNIGESPPMLRIFKNQNDASTYLVSKVLQSGKIKGKEADLFKNMSSLKSVESERKKEEFSADISAMDAAELRLLLEEKGFERIYRDEYEKEEDEEVHLSEKEKRKLKRKRRREAKERRKRRREQRESEKKENEFKAKIHLGENMGINLPYSVFGAIGAVSVAVIACVVLRLRRIKRDNANENEERRKVAAKKEIRKRQKISRRVKVN